MNSLEILKREHRLIRQALDAAAQAQGALEKGKRPPREFFDKAIRFARTFADRFHHFKEEFLMFGLLADKMEGRYDGEIGALRYQHERGRRCIDDIENSLDGYAQQDPIATTNLLVGLASYIALLRLHIHIEDHVFFKMVEKDISEEEERLLLEQFEHEEKSNQGSDFFEAIRQLVSELNLMIQS